MMEKFKKSGFWVAIVAFVIMLAQLFGVKIDAPYVNEIVNSVCAVCVLLGIGSAKAQTDKTDDGTKKEEENTDNTDDNDNP